VLEPIFNVKIQQLAAAARGMFFVRLGGTYAE
jgi:hypothetical protein